MHKTIEHGPTAGQFRPLLPRHGVRLFAPARDDDRFARRFVETWRRLPYRVRRKILRHWKSGASPFTRSAPLIELLPDWSGRGGEPAPRGTKAAAGMMGHNLVFCSGIVDMYPDELVRDLIAQELAHVEQWASGWDIDQADPFECEEDADGLVEDWGFSPTAMDDWDMAHGLAEVLVIDDLDDAAQVESSNRLILQALKAGR
jgi:hypothetical protein